MTRFVKKFDYIIDTFFSRYIEDRTEVVKYMEIFNNNLEMLLSNRRFGNKLFENMEANSFYNDKVLEMYLDKYQLVEKPNDVLSSLKKGGTIKVIVKYIETGIEDILILNDFYQKYNLYLEIKELEK